MQKFTLDAENKKVGRVASEAAKLLMGKNLTEYVRNAIPSVEVEITNAEKADVGAQKLGEILKSSYSGYPSGIKSPTVQEILGKKGKSELFRKAVYGMLPKNKLRSKMMLNLKISE